MASSSTSETEPVESTGAREAGYSEHYPYPSHVNAAASFVSIKLSSNGNYGGWQEQMRCLLECHDMIGFINGKLKAPVEYGEKWKRSDTLVKGWIFGSLSEDAMETVVGLDTAYDVWEKLKTTYSTPAAAPGNEEIIKIISLMETRVAEFQGADNMKDSVEYLLDCKEKGRDLGNQRPPSIFRVPYVCRELSPRSFNPTVVSIGPLHRHDIKLQQFEAQKRIYLHRLLDRSGDNAEETLQECVKKVRGKVELIKACYAEPIIITIQDDVEFARQMVIDACFILYFTHLLSQNDDLIPYLGNGLVTSNITYDLVLIENQIPFFVLEDIFESTVRKFKPWTSLVKHLEILLICTNTFGDEISKRKVNLYSTHDHILGLVHKSIRPAHAIPLGFGVKPKRHSAVELDRAGVNFMSNQDKKWALAMKVESLPKFSRFPWFWRKPTLMMPRLDIHDGTELLLRNLIIYEQCSPVRKYVATYMWAMGMLIDGPADVAKLVKSGVLFTLSSDKNVFNIIYNICKEVVYDDFTYMKEWEDLDTYYNRYRYWPNALAGLKRTYFSSPWNIIAFLAGIVLFILTVLQTIFTIMSANP